MDTKQVDDLLEEPPSLQGVAQERRALSADRSHRSAPRRRAVRSRHARASSRRCTTSRPRSATRSSACSPRTRARRWARWATTRRCRCSRPRCARSTIISASSSRRSPIRRSIACARASSCRCRRRSGPNATSSSPAAQHAEQIVLSSPVLSQRKLRQIMGLEDAGVPHAFIDLQSDDAVDLKTAILKVCDEAEAAVRAGKLVLLLVRPLSREGQDADSCAARDRRRASPAGQDRAALQVQHPGGDGHGARCASLRVPDRLRRDGGVSVSRLSNAVRSHAQGRAHRCRLAPGARPQLPARHPQGAVQDHVQDGHLDHRELSQRAAVRDRGPRLRGR